MSVKDLALAVAYGRWRRPSPFEPGYAVLLPSPSDMPFLLRLGLEGLAHLDLEHCRQILVVPDGTTDDDGPLRRVAAEFNDPRIEFIAPGLVDRLAARKLRGNGSALHWLAIVLGTEAARTEHIFLHDADAFFLEPGGLERQYRACRERGLDTLGVTARWDDTFARIGYTIPGTWEMMYANRWARRHRPADHKGRRRPTPHGAIVFDTMLYPQYLDHPAGKVGVMADPPRFVHFNGTIVTYRVFKNRAGATVVDELCRLLLLSLLQELLPPADGRRERDLPAVAELAAGLGDPSARVRYDTDRTAAGYPEFRAQLGELCEAPIFRGERAKRLLDLIRPFDDDFAAREPVGDAAPAGFREHGLG